MFDYRTRRQRICEDETRELSVLEGKTVKRAYSVFDECDRDLFVIEFTDGQKVSFWGMSEEGAAMFSIQGAK